MSVSPTPPSTALAVPSRREGVIRLGMPQLAFGGLAEGWLLKELGDRHWRLIAESVGLDDPDFRDMDGAPIYPAFCGTSIEGASFDQLGEHDDLIISSELARVSHTQFASRHRLQSRGGAVGAVSLSSAFVKRSRTGHNGALARVAPEILSRLPIQRGGAEITTLASAVRAGVWHSHFGFTPKGAEPRRWATFQPCPAQDFNGAGFLYFPSFSAFVDRAEWAALGLTGLVTARDVIYLGNVDPGEEIHVTARGIRFTEEDVSHWCSVTAADDRVLAEVFTRKTRRG